MSQLLSYLASLKLTFFLLILLLVVIVITHNAELSYVTFLSLPLFLLCANLVAAIISNKAFQQNLPLLYFHLTLLATVVLIALSQLTFLEGWVELNEGETFTGKLDGQTQGIFHQFNLQQGDFTNLAVQLEFTPLVAITAIRSRVLTSINEQEQEIVIGEQKPLLIRNYRFYVTRNVGYSAEFTWQAFNTEGKHAAPETGTLNFPPFLSNEFGQTNQWQPANSQAELWFLLQPESDILAERKPTQLTLPQNHHLVIRHGEQRHIVRAGQQLKLADGALTYHGLRTWMGYKVHYDPYKSYLLACSILTVLCLAWFYWQKFTRKSWLAPTI